MCIHQISSISLENPDSHALGLERALCACVRVVLRVETKACHMVDTSPYH